MNPPLIPATTNGAIAASTTTCAAYHFTFNCALCIMNCALSLYNLQIPYTTTPNNTTRYHCCSTSVPMIPPKFPSFWNSLNTVVVVLRIVYLKYTLSARFIASATLLMIIYTHFVGFLQGNSSAITIYGIFVTSIAAVSNTRPPPNISIRCPHVSPCSK